MAQHKYDLVTVPTEPKGPQKHHPWYKERLRLKYLKTSKQPATLDGERWTFVAGNIDDFRSGVPVQTCGHGMVVKKEVNPVPIIDTRSSEELDTRRGGRRRTYELHNNPGIRTLYSRTGPRRQMQQEHVGDVMSSLLEHPLGLYPHLEESVPPELLEDVVGILDPELRPTDSDSDLSSSAPGSPPGLPVDEHDESKEESESPVQTSIYHWPLIKTEEERQKEQSLMASQKAVSATQESRVNQVTHDLVQWVRNLGDTDTKHDVDEATIKNLFSSDYENKREPGNEAAQTQLCFNAQGLAPKCLSQPALMAPINVIELENVPAELRLTSRALSSSLNYSTAHHWERTTVPGMELEEPRYVRSRYGAWYLPKNLWRMKPSNEPLRDPKEEAAEADSEAAVRSREIDKMLLDLHGARAFKDYIALRNPGARVPEFLRSVNTAKKHSPMHKKLLQTAPL